MSLPSSLATNSTKKMPDTLPLDSDITIEVDDSTFVRRLSDKDRACDTLPFDSEVTIENDQ